MRRDLLIKNARVWPAAGQPVIEKGSVLVRDGRIAKVGRFTARADDVVDADGQLLMPGLIQGHIHLCQTIFRGAGEDLPLLPWLRRVIWPLEAAHDEESIRVSAQLACAEMIRGGTTAFLSIETVRHTEHAFRAVHEAGLMGVIGHCLMDMTGGYRPLAVDVEDALADLDLLQERWGDHPRLRVGVAPRFALSCSGKNMRKAADYAREHGLLLHTHASEQVAEVDIVLERTGKHNIDYLHSVGLSGPDVCLAHCVHTQPGERHLLQEMQTKVLHCPSANLKLASGIAPIPEYLDMGITVSIGADGTPCNNARGGVDAENPFGRRGVARSGHRSNGDRRRGPDDRMGKRHGHHRGRQTREPHHCEPGQRAHTALHRSGDQRGLFQQRLGRLDDDRGRADPLRGRRAHDDRRGEAARRRAPAAPAVDEARRVGIVLHGVDRSGDRVNMTVSCGRAPQRGKLDRTFTGFICPPAGLPRRSKSSPATRTGVQPCAVRRIRIAEANARAPNRETRLFFAR